jgi:hypothetical protein
VCESGDLASVAEITVNPPHEAIDRRRNQQCQSQQSGRMHGSSCRPHQFLLPPLQSPSKPVTSFNHLLAPLVDRSRIAAASPPTRGSGFRLNFQHRTRQVAVACALSGSEALRPSAGKVVEGFLPSSRRGAKWSDSFPLSDFGHYIISPSRYN